MYSFAAINLFDWCRSCALVLHCISSSNSYGDDSNRKLFVDLTKRYVLLVFYSEEIIIIVNSEHLFIGLWFGSNLFDSNFDE